MKHTVESIKTISSGADDARCIVSEFCREALAEGQQRLDSVIAIVNLHEILNAEVLQKAADARAGIRHLCTAMREVAEHHGRSAQAGRFDAAVRELEEMRRIVEARYRNLHTLYTRD